MAALVAGEVRAAPLSMLEPAGPVAAAIAQIWWVMFWGSVVILAVVFAMAIYPFLRPPRSRKVATGPFLWGGGLAFPIVVLAVLLTYALTTGQALVTSREAGALRVEVRAQQWWWEFVYPDEGGGPLYTATELHVPAGRQVEVHVTSDDVVHSFWVPRLGGKIDAIPGRTTTIALRADRPGRYLGQCAEFCGLQHAAMAFVVEAHPPQEFAERMAALSASARDPSHPGAADFRASCAHCHSTEAAVRGGGAPNLAALIGRRRIGADATAFRGPTDLRRWLRTHQSSTSGPRRPGHHDLDDAALDRLVSYLTR